MSLKKMLLSACAFALVGAAHVGTAVSAPDCPPPRHYSGGCIQQVVWAKNPTTGTCCEYATPCNAPDGWVTYGTYSACVTA